MANKQRYTDEQIARVLRQTMGNMTATAQSLGCDRTTVYIRVKASPLLQTVCEEARESFIDLAESAMQKAVREGDVSATKYVLSTLGKNRGYCEKQEVKIDGLESITINCGLKPINKDDK